MEYAVQKLSHKNYVPEIYTARMALNCIGILRFFFEQKFQRSFPRTFCSNYRR